MPGLSPELLLRAYCQGYFPMAEGRETDELFWLDPEQRGVLPLDGFHIPRRLARTVRAERFDVRVDTAFEDVMRACAAPRPGHEDSWINGEILALYCALFEQGYAHCVECWREGELAGGLYGVHIGAAFFGESMFSRRRDASKVALVHLVARLCAGGFKLLDTQFVTPHLSGFGVVEIPRSVYRRRLREAVNSSADFYSLPEPCTGVEALQSITQIS
ncbi:MAG: leucyl/phenylalanyl-tRNA--protein transferase [Pseudomonadota bacterium]|jgi:leucyl/phenylalanyl-tRNA---protein transferase